MTNKENKSIIDTSEQPQEAETFNFADSYDQWTAYLKSLPESNLPNYKVLTDGALVEHFKTAKGFMTGPVALFNGKAVEAKTRKFTSIDDLKEQIDVSNVYIYMSVDQSGRKIKKLYHQEATEILLAQQAAVPEEMYEDVVEYAIRYSDA
jgi:hypothetical protein